MVRVVKRKRVIQVDSLWKAGVEVRDKAQPKIEPEDNRHLKVSLGEILIAKQIQGKGVKNGES